MGERMKFEPSGEDTTKILTMPKGFDTSEAWVPGTRFVIVGGTRRFWLMPDHRPLAAPDAPPPEAP